MTALVVETLEQRLERLLPGAVVEERRDAKPDSCFVVTRLVSKGTYQVMGVGASRREAIERALFLYGRSR